MLLSHIHIGFECWGFSIFDWPNGVLFTSTSASICRGPVVHFVLKLKVPIFEGDLYLLAVISKFSAQINVTCFDFCSVLEWHFWPLSFLWLLCFWYFVHSSAQYVYHLQIVSFLTIIPLSIFMYMATTEIFQATVSKCQKAWSVWNLYEKDYILQYKYFDVSNKCIAGTKNIINGPIH